MKKHTKHLLMFVIILVVSCDKEEIVPTIDKDNLLTQVYINNILKEEFIYNDDGYLTESKNPYSYAKHFYQGQRLLSTDYYYGGRLDDESDITKWVTPSTAYKIETRTYHYDSKGKMTGFSQSGYTSFLYDDSGRVNRVNFYTDESKTVSGGYIEYKYDNRNNLIEKLQYIKNDNQVKLSSSCKYEYDDQRNPYSSWFYLGMPGTTTNMNNIIKQTDYSYSGNAGGEALEFVITYQYTYNERGYPESYMLNGVSVGSFKYKE